MVLPTALYKRSASTSLRVLISTIVAIIVAAVFFMLAGHSLQQQREKQQFELAKTGLMYASHLADDLD